MDDELFGLAQTVWNYLNLDGPLEPADCVVGLGSYDLRVADRCAELYHLQFGRQIIFSGHLGNWTKALWSRSEAEVFADRAVEAGVPRSHIQLEDRSTNIGENILFTKELLRNRGSQTQSVTFVTKPATERRVFATIRRLWPEMRSFITSPKIGFREQYEQGIGENLIHEMVGDVHRMAIYPGLGFQIAQEIPEGVARAVEQLVRLGYDQHLVGK
jgi:uncharacterized SAM-binding protein YcdF (DUF218 family)